MAIFILLAGLMGAGGIMIAAAGAHAAPGAALDSAAYMLLFHATAVLVGAALAQQGLLWRPITVVVLSAWVIGGILFAGDIVLHAFAGQHLFAMAAPTGGIILSPAGSGSRPLPWSFWREARDSSSDERRTHLTPAW